MSRIPEISTYTSKEAFRAYQGVFTSPNGYIVLEDLKHAHHFYGSLLGDGAGPIDPMRMAIAEGERNVILRILAILQSKDEDYVSRTSAQ